MKLAEAMAKAAIDAPTSPIVMPVRNPLRRPTRFIHNDAGKVESAAPMT